MFSYDLVSAHRVITGGSDVFDECRHHEDATRIPAIEATRLLFNRCTGLLLAREILAKKRLSEHDADFVQRNIAKAKLALGDAVLTVSDRPNGITPFDPFEIYKPLLRSHPQAVA